LFIYIIDLFEDDLPPGGFCDVVLFPVCLCGPSNEDPLASRIAAVVMQVAAVIPCPESD
jgi:hypothetical protein